MKNPEPKKLLLFAAAVISLAALILPGCAHQGPILADFGYEPPKTGPEGLPPKIMIGVSPFKDSRGKKDSVIGKRFSSVNDEVNDIVVQGTVAERVTGALKDALEARKITVKEDPSWDLTDKGIPVNEADLVLSGQISTFWVEALSSFANTKLTAKVEIRVVAADVAQKKIVRTLKVSSTIERSNVVFSPAFAQETISEAVSAAINQIFSDEELKKRLR